MSAIRLGGGVRITEYTPKMERLPDRNDVSEDPVYRRVLDALVRPMLSSEVAKALDMTSRSASGALRALQDRGLVECDPMGFYRRKRAK